MSEDFTEGMVTWVSLAKTVGTTVSVMIAVGGVVWTVASRVSAINDQMERQEHRIAEVTALIDTRTLKGEAERQRVEASSVARHQQQQAEIDRLRLQAESVSSSVAVISNQLFALSEMLREVRSDVRANAGRVVIEQQPTPPQTRLDRLAPPTWGASPTVRGVR